MNTVTPTTEITVTMTAEEWNKVLDTLTSGPYKIVAPLIQKIMQQGEASAKSNRNSEEPVMAER